MKFTVGYQLQEEEEASLTEIILQNAGNIEEVYFPWLDNATGRASLTNQRGCVDWQGQEKLEKDLMRLRNAGIKLDLLFNANCYGSKSISRYLANQVCSVLQHLERAVDGADVVTTTSPAIAHIVKQNFPKVEVRASVNMRIGTVKGMQYVSHLFDSFYIQREYNRDFEKIKELKSWCDANGKKLLMLANSGCMNFCSGQTFHDNLVAHENEITEMVNIPGWTPHVCWNYYKSQENWVSVLQNSWVRPEDLYHYEEYFPVVKLATRMHQLPGMVVKSYIDRKYYGNLLDLFEPGFGPAFAPHVLDNSKFPADWFNTTSKCDKKCHECSYCNTVLDKALINSECV